MNLLIQSPQALGRAIRDVRRKSGLTQAQASELAGIGQPTWSNVERGVTDVSLSTLLRITAALRLELVLQDRSTTSPDPWEQS